MTDPQRRRIVSRSSILIGASLFISVFYTNRGEVEEEEERRMTIGRTMNIEHDEDVQ